MNTKKSFAIIGALACVSITAYAAPVVTSPFLDLIEDEPNVMVINAVPTQAPELSLGLSSMLDEKINALLQPAFVQTILDSYSHPLSDINLDAFATGKNNPANAALFAAPTTTILLERAVIFQKARLVPAARAQAEYVLTLDSKNRQAEAFLKNLDRTSKQAESSKYLIDQEFSRGMKAYEQGRWNEALEHFIRVANMDPHNEAARDRISMLQEKVGKSPAVGAP